MLGGIGDIALQFDRGAIPRRKLHERHAEVAALDCEIRIDLAQHARAGR